MNINLNGFWISPAGEIFPVDWHLDEIVRNPIRFGFTNEQIKEIFIKNEEEEMYQSDRITDCLAGIEIIEQVLKNGWIYIFYHEKIDRYTIELNNFTDIIKEYIQNWASELIKIKPNSKYSEVSIFDLFYEPHYLDYTDNGKLPFYNEREWRVLQHPSICVDSVHDCLGIRHNIRCKIFVKRMFGWEISHSRKLTRSEINDVLNNIKLASDFNCFVGHIANGIFIKSSGKPHIPIPILAAIRE